MSKNATPGRPSNASSKEERLSAALRENLKRRKAQSRQRQDRLPPGSNVADEEASNAKEPKKDKN